jgi:hypothetical protein
MFDCMNEITPLPELSHELDGVIFQDLIREVRSLAASAGYPCMLANPQIVSAIASERLLARQRAAAELSAPTRKSA